MEFKFLQVESQCGQSTSNSEEMHSSPFLNHTKKFQESVLTKISRYPKINTNATNKMNCIALFHNGIPFAPLRSRQPVFSTYTPIIRRGGLSGDALKYFFQCQSTWNNATKNPTVPAHKNTNSCQADLQKVTM